jgi:hypothetical protein
LKTIKFRDLNNCESLKLLTYKHIKCDSQEPFIFIKYFENREDLEKFLRKDQNDWHAAIKNSVGKDLISFNSYEKE